MIYSDTPAVDSGVKVAQVFIGTKSLVTDVYPLKTDKQFVNTLIDNIIDRGAPTKLLSNQAQVQVSNKVHGLLRSLVIGNWQSTLPQPATEPC